MASLASVGPFTSSSFNFSEFYATWPHFKDEDSLAGYRCIFCKKVLRPLVIQLYCGHRLCGHGCLPDLLSSGNKQCPGPDKECQELDITDENTFFPDISISRELIKLIVFCNNKQFGCPVELSWRNLEDHLNICEFKAQECRNAFRGCPVKLPARLINNHEENECLYVYIECPICSENILKIEYDEHQRECSQKQKSCLFNVIGCTFTSNNVDDLKKHRTEGLLLHLQLLQTECEKLMRSYSKSESEFRKINEIYVEINKSIEEVSHDTKHFKEKTDLKIRNLQKLTGKNAEQIVGLKQLEKILSSVQAIKERIDSNERKILQLHNSQGGASATSLPPDLQVKLPTIQKSIDSQTTFLEEYALKFQCLETTTYSGPFIWKISDYRQRKEDALNGQVLSIFSQPFYTSPFGYKLCLRLYPNGDGLGKGTHLSLFIVIMKSEYDALLHWPFRSKVKLSLMDQETHKKNHSDSFTPDPTSNSFKRPTSNANIASGFPMFIPQSLAENPVYLKDDVIFVKAEVETFF